MAAACDLIDNSYRLQHDPEGRSALTHYLVLEYCDGGDLADFLEARKRTGYRGLDEDTTRRLLRMLAMGLREMHSRNIVHVCVPSCSCDAAHILLPPFHAWHAVNV
jgi:serine/threonine protein kinase